MKILRLFFLSLGLLFGFVQNNQSHFNTSGGIVIREAVLADIPATLDLDFKVSKEYFKPFYSNYYSHLPIGKEPDYFLDLELNNDKKLFYDCVNKVANEILYVAYHEQTHSVVGLILFHKENIESAEIDLLLIDKDYRRRGIGRKLIQAMLITCKECAICAVFPFACDKNALNFYTSLGFVIKGVGPKDRINIYGIRYDELYVYCELRI